MEKEDLSSDLEFPQNTNSTKLMLYVQRDQLLNINEHENVEKTSQHTKSSIFGYYF